MRARGFTEEEINRAVRKWKDAHDWQTLSGRNPPGERDIARAFGGNKGLTTKDMEDEMRRRKEHEDTREKERERERSRKADEDERNRRREKERKWAMDGDWGRNSSEHVNQRSSEYRRKESCYYDPEDKYHGIPHAGYICNRCGREGRVAQA